MHNVDAGSDPGVAPRLSAWHSVTTDTFQSRHERYNRMICDITATILIIEDDDGNRLLVQRVLEECGYRVVGAEDGPSALLAASRHTFDAIVLDLGLPGMDGLSVLAGLRRASEVPILVLTGRSDEHDRVLGLDSGADDYMVKPYSIAELTARVRALLRRVQPQPQHDTLDFGILSLDLAAHRAKVGSTPVELTPKEFALLRFLVEQSPFAFGRDEILQHVWGSLAEWQDPATVTEHIRRLRSKLLAAGCVDAVIETVRGVGYRALAAQ